VPGLGEAGPVDPQRQQGRHHRPHRPHRPVEDLERHRPPVRQRRGEDALGAVLGDQAGGEQRTVQVEAGPQHRHGLHRFE
jgi:hypothetical protein